MIIYQEYKVYAGNMYCGMLNVIGSTYPNTLTAHLFEPVPASKKAGTLQRSYHSKVAGYKNLRLVRIS